MRTFFLNKEWVKGMKQKLKGLNKRAKILLQILKILSSFYSLYFVALDILSIFLYFYPYFSAFFSTPLFSVSLLSILISTCIPWSSCDIEEYLQESLLLLIIMWVKRIIPYSGLCSWLQTVILILYITYDWFHPNSQSKYVCSLFVLLCVFC